ncbi:MAG TPA: phosphatase PAP2 family protein [Cyclobacteriaceae bacterium]|nr:phosphatase PAP2 family protein [Cyclobacteriaceae bacterium]HRK55617.1 phosphatase PAP2 family protein [Cyclobacteriaceae bacterium]
MERLLELDKELLLYFNGFHASWLDPVMILATKTIFWLPLYLFLIYLIAKFKKWDTFYYLLGVAICIALTDQITSGFMKPFFARLRPSHEPSLEGLLHIVNNYRGGSFSFASGHAANTFGVAMFVFLLFRGRYHWMSVIFLWSAFMSYTRIYLGVHYPGDIIVGILIGLCCGWVGYQFSNWLIQYVQKRKSRKLMDTH